MADDVIEIRDFDEVAEVLMGRPRRTAHLLVLGLLLALLVAVAWAAYSRFDLTVKANGTVRPEGEVARVEAAVAGTVLEVLVQEGDSVPEGAVLARLDLPPQRSEAGRLATTLGSRVEQSEAQRRSRATLVEQQTLDERARDEALREAEERLAAEGRDRRAREEKARSDVRVASLELESAQTSEGLKKKLFDAQSGSEEDWKAATRVRVLAEERLAQANRALESIDGSGITLAQRALDRQKADADARRLAARRQLEDLDQELARLQGEIAELRQRESALREELAKGEVKAPCGGTVMSLSVRRPGELVQVGEPVAVIVPRESVLIVEAWVANQDIGFLRRGMPVRYRFHAFPYHRYGTLAGRVKRIASDAEVMETPEGRALAYRVTLTLDATEFRRGDEALRVQIGMLTEVHAITGTETALSLVWRKVKDKFAP